MFRRLLQTTFPSVLGMAGLLMALFILVPDAAKADGHWQVQAELEAVADLPVPVLAMNQLPVLDAYRDRIVALAAAGTDAKAQALVAIIDSYRQAVGPVVFYGAWTDEAHPQHKGVHGILGGTAVLLERLKAGKPTDALLALDAEVARALVNAGAGEICTTAAVMATLGPVEPVTYGSLTGYYVAKYGNLLAAMVLFAGLMVCVAIAHRRLNAQRRVVLAQAVARI